MLEGGAGPLMGEDGDDTLDGGSGYDAFVLQVRHGTDTILDSTAGDDMIDLSAVTGITAFTDLTITTDGTTAVIDLTSEGGGTIRLEDTDVADVDATDFTLSDDGM